MWQDRQFSSTGGCPNMNGPRLSAWQEKHCWFTVSCFTMAGVRAPCGLWQSEHFTLPSRIGWCEGFIVALRTCLWHVPQMSASIGRGVVV